MTTSAINRNSVSTRPGHLKTQNFDLTNHPVGSETDSVLRLVEFDWDSESRPASGSSPFVGKYGWRNCRAWSHSGRKWYYPGNTVVRLLDFPSSKVRQTYLDGSFWGIVPPAVPAFPSSLINQAEVKALNKLKDQDFNLGQFMAEFDQTAKMVAGSVLRIARGVRQWRRKNPTHLWEGVRAWEGSGRPIGVIREKLPASWLELQYGWKPLLSDIHGAIQYLGRPGREALVHVKGYAERTQRLPVTVNPVAGTSKCVADVECKEQCWVSLYYELKDAALATQSQLGLLNPLELVWECLPYSFVVDWVVPIGPWMSALTADAGFLFKGGSSSRKTTLRDYSVKSVDFENFSTLTSAVITSGSVPDLQGSAYSFTRSCYASSPVPGLYVKNPLSTLHVLNAIALLVQAFR